MKLNKNIKLFYSIFLVAALMSTFTFMVLVSPAVSQENSASVVLVHLSYANERWSLGENGVLVLPCEGPSKFLRGTERDPLVLVLAKGEPIYQRHIFDPLVILPEDEDVETELKEISFTMPFALADGMEEFQFWYKPEQQEPSLVVDLREAIKAYMEKGGPNQKASCQQPVPEFQDLKLD
jgi:hypothetical protein